MRVAECILLHVLAGPLVCFAFPCMAAQQTAMLDMRDANPTIIRPPFDPIRVRPAALVTILFSLGELKHRHADMLSCVCTTMEILAMHMGTVLCTLSVNLFRAC